MLTKEGCQARQKRLWDAVPDHLEWILIADPRHVLYLSNFLVQPCSFSRGERALLLLDREKGLTLIGDNFTLRSAAAEFYVDREAVETWYDHKHSVENRDHALFKALASVVPQLKGRPGAIEAEWLPVGALLELEITQTDATLELGSILRQLRRQKHDDEVALLKQCMQACDAGHACAREIVEAGKSEFDIFRKVQAAVLQAAGLPVIIYGDFRASTPEVPKAGGLPSGHVLDNGDLFVLDYSVVIHGYRSDFTNTIAVGEPSAEQEKLFGLCQAAMQGGESTLKAGTKCADVHAATAAPIWDAGYKENFQHHAGHGLGLGHPEAPILVPESIDTLLAGDVVTLEPGVYVEGIGGMRIEHNYLITEDGFERLSNHVIALK